MMNQELERLDVEVHEPNQLEYLLTAAEYSLREVALASGTSGILVTRLNSHRYTVELSRSVPFGQTVELCRVEECRQK